MKNNIFDTINRFTGFILLILLISTNNFAQTKNEAVDFYVDSTKIDKDKYFINPNSIQKLDIRTDNTNKKEGRKIFLSLKKETVFVTTKDIIDNYKLDKQKKYVINSINVDEKRNIDTLGVRIDFSFIKKAMIIKDTFSNHYSLFVITTNFGNTLKGRSIENDSTLWKAPRVWIR